MSESGVESERGEGGGGQKKIVTDRQKGKGGDRRRSGEREGGCNIT